MCLTLQIIQIHPLQACCYLIVQQEVIHIFFSSLCKSGTCYYDPPLPKTFSCQFIMSEATTDGFWNSHSWNLSFRRLLNDWEVDRVAEMLKIFEVFQGTREDLISWNWKGEEIKIFTLRSAFSKLTGPYQVMEWSWKSI